MASIKFHCLIQIMSTAGPIIFGITFILIIFGKVNYSSRVEQKHIESLMLQMLII